MSLWLLSASFFHQLQTYNCVSLLFSAWRWWLVGLISFLCVRTAAYHLLERCACEPHQQRCSHRAKFRINGDKSVCSYCERPLSPCHGCFRVVSWYTVIAKISIAECIFRRSTPCISSVTWGFVKCKWEQRIHSYTWNNMHVEGYVLNHTDTQPPPPLALPIHCLWLVLQSITKTARHETCFILCTITLMNNQLCKHPLSKCKLCSTAPDQLSKQHK